ncbi:hypothetical protein [Burkholderia gladioli]|uniref:hypothetical protein n=1 Tax=Burkholderia gladioli TaxID=28095 RepID=UPI00163F1819|nr:hypothetical protein [Burkholderia gladioli]MDN7753693.1 hypothetical protein [Burkholderia gladioli]
MINEDKYLRAARVMVFVNSYAPLLRHELLSRPDILDQDEIETDATITLGSEDLSFLRSQLFPAIASAYDRISTPAIKTVAGDEWMIVFVGESQPPNVALVQGDKRFIVAQFALLAPEIKMRLHALEQIADQNQLSSDVIDRWRVLLEQRVPTDREITALQDELQNTPIRVAEAIRESLETGNLSLDTLVPRDEAYYRQLIGGIGSAITLENYVAEVTAPFLAELLAGGHRRALSLAWPLCSHQSVSPLIEREWKGDEQVLVAEILRLTESGDPISRTGAIEVGLRRVQKHPALTQPLAALINAFLDGDPTDKIDEFELHSALFTCIYAQMAKRRILATWQPFVRRLAALAHASWIGNHFLTLVADRTEVVHWLQNVSDRYFVIQTLLDMRVEPRWFPELGSAEQWKNELLGRVWMAANCAPEAVKDLGLEERLIGNAAQVFTHQIDRAAAHLPGPLEGGTRSQIELLPEVTAQLTESLQGIIDTTTFISLINASMWFHIPDHLAGLVADALERSHYQIQANEHVSLSACLLGLASVAAVSRSTKLCEAIRTTLRVNWRVAPGRLTADETFRIGICACAAHADLADWATHVGQFLTELSLQDLSTEDAEIFQSHVQTMCHLVPELWGTCGQAHASFGLIAGK